MSHLIWIQTYNQCGRWRRRWLHLHPLSRSLVSLCRFSMSRHTTIWMSESESNKISLDLMKKDSIYSFQDWEFVEFDVNCWRCRVPEGYEDPTSLIEVFLKLLSPYCKGWLLYIMLPLLYLQLTTTESCKNALDYLCH